MNNKEPAYVYILPRSTSGRLQTCKNPSFREDWVKIGKSSHPVDVRSKELANTAVPLPLEKKAQRFLTLLRPLEYKNHLAEKYETNNIAKMGEVFSNFYKWFMLKLSANEVLGMDILI